MNKTAALVATVFPGLGHLLRYQNAKGLVLAVCFTTAFCGLLVGTYLYGAESNTSAFALLCLVAMLVLWIIAFVDIIKSMYFVDEAAAQEEKARLYRQALQFGLKGDPKGAKNSLEAALKLDRYDADVLFQLGVVMLRLGETARGRRLLKNSLEADTEEKWRWEIMRILSQSP